MMPVLHLIVYGVPAPQGSKRAMISKGTGRPIMVEQSERLGPWRDNVRHEAIVAQAGGRLGLDEPVVVDMVFTFARPRSHYRTGRNAHLLRDGAPARPDGSPDLSKLARAVEDSLTDASVWLNDSRVVEYGRLAKVYVGEDGDSLDRPGVFVRVWTVAQLLDQFPRRPRFTTDDHAATLFDPESPPGAGDDHPVLAPGWGS